MEVDPLLLKKNTKKNNDELFLFFYIFNHFYNITHSYISLPHKCSWDILSKKTSKM